MNKDATQQQCLSANISSSTTGIHIKPLCDHALHP
jgi:hypothetical protein